MTDFIDHLKHIPPWGYALIAAGVLGLSLFVGKKNTAQNSGGVTQTIAPVDPSAETAANDSLNRMQDMYNQLGAKYDQNVQNEANMQAGINYLSQQIKDLKSATPPSIAAIPSSPVVNHPAPVVSHPAPVVSRPVSHPSGHWYTIKRGDTLSQIALDAYHTNPYNGNINKIAQANRLSNPNRIYAGSKLWIPS